jgi:hypothetical protein
MTMAKRLGASAVLLLGVLGLGVNGCSAGPEDRTGSAGEAAQTTTGGTNTTTSGNGAPACTAPFTAKLCSLSCNPTGGGSSGGGTSQWLRIHTEGCVTVCSCQPVTAAPNGGSPAYSCAANGATLVESPPSSLAGCTVGKDIRVASPVCGVQGGKIFACPQSVAPYPAAITPGLNGCVANQHGGFVDPQGGPYCEMMTSGHSISSSCVGDTVEDTWTLVEYLVVPSGYSLPTASDPPINGCEGGCMLPH